MSREGAKFMRLLVFFDLPVKSKKERSDAGKFRRFLLTEGYHMVQLSVYSRICRGQDMVNSYLAHLKGHLPPYGSVRALQVTEQQYARMKTVLGNIPLAEKEGPLQLLLL